MTTTATGRRGIPTGTVCRVEAPGTGWHDLLVRVDSPDGDRRACTTSTGERLRVPARLLVPTDLDGLPDPPAAAYAAGDIVTARLPEAYGFAADRLFVVTGVDPFEPNGRSVGLAPLLPVGAERGKTWKVGPRILTAAV